MTTETETETTPTERLAHTAGGGVDLARGAVFLTARSVVSGISRLTSRYRASRLPHNLADARSAVRHELVAAQEAVAGLPQTLAETRGHGGRRRGLYIGAAAGAAVLVGGAALFSSLRRSRKRKPSPLPPSVQVEPRP